MYQLLQNRSNKEKLKFLNNIFHFLYSTIALYLIISYLSKNLGPEPERQLQLFTGKLGLITLLASQSISLIIWMTKIRWLQPLRRTFGLYAFWIIIVHVCVLVVLDYQFQLNFLLNDVLGKQFVYYGLASGNILLILAITSTKYWKRKLKKNWKKLHLVTYAASILASIHFLLARKVGVPLPMYYMFVVIIIGVLRIPAIRRVALNPLLARVNK